jgi:hypothetical protein
MTAKEEALRLVDKYSVKSNEFGEGTEWDYDKQCALICVDEKIKEIKEIQFNEDIFMEDTVISYWQEVKQEIKKL